MAAAESERTVMLQPPAKRRHSNPTPDHAGIKRARTSSCGVSHLDGNGDGSALHLWNLHSVCSAQSDDTESCHSFQGYETALVKDSSDDLWFLDDEDNLSLSSTVRVAPERSVDDNDPSELEEFEVLTDSSESIISEASTVDYDEIASADEIFVLCDDSSSDGWADFSSLDKDSDEGSDDSSSECDSDPDRFQKDMWYCERCNRMNPPLRGCCDQCWGMRPGWHSESAEGLRKKHSRPRRRQQRKARNCRPPAVAERVGSVTGEGSSYTSPGAAVSDLKSDDTIHVSKSFQADAVRSLSAVAEFGRWRNASSSDSSSSSSSDTDEIKSLEAVTSLRSNGRPEDESTSAVVRSVPLAVPGSSASSKMPARPISRSFSLCHVEHTDELCVVCLSRKKNASIVHGSTGHQACCYTCAREMQFRMKPCPVCRRPIRKVIRNYFVSSR